MVYVWFVVIGLVVGLVVGKFLAGNNFGIPSDIVFAIGGAFTFGVGLAASGLGTTGSMGGQLVMAAMGALFLRRVLKVV
ncbi:MAG: hypothetical protein O2979_03815 [Proteobacteria bacterium]|nr:hypothetical protein [Pseudomonadota bacterium]